MSGDPPYPPRVGAVHDYFGDVTVVLASVDVHGCSLCLVLFDGQLFSSYDRDRAGSVQRYHHDNLRRPL